MLLAQNEEGHTAWQLAAKTGHFEALQKLWVWVGEAQMNRNELKNNLLMVKDQYVHTAWHRAAETGSLDELEILWSCAKETELNTDELLLAQNEERNTAWEVAAQTGHFEVLTLRRLMSYIYGAPILDVSRSHTTTQHSR